MLEPLASHEGGMGWKKGGGEHQGEVVENREGKTGEGKKDNREGEDKEHLVKVRSVNGRVMWHSAQCEISTSLSYNDWGEGELKQRGIIRHQAGTE